MSSMKVQITLTPFALKSSRVRSAATAAFGERVKSLFNCVRDVNVICTAEQFAYFIFERDRLGGQNSIKELEIKLIGAPAVIPTLDVTGGIYA